MNRFHCLLSRMFLPVAVLTLAVLLLLISLFETTQAAYMPSDGGKTLHIIMYHSILKDPARTGKYVVTPAQLRTDFEYLRKHGYTSVLPRDLVKYAKGEADLPEKCVMLTFDDGYYNNLLYLLPLLEEYSFNALISVVGKFTRLYTDSGDKNPNYAHLSYDDIRLLDASGKIEIGNHTYDMHKLEPIRGSGRKKGESDAQYDKRLSGDLMKLQKELENNGITVPVCYTYPFGIIGSGSLSTVKKCGFSVSLSCSEKSNTITRDPESLWLLGRYNRSGLVNTESFMKKAGIV